MQITFACSHRHTIARLGPQGQAAFLESTPPISVTPRWHERKKEIVRLGLKAPDVDKSLRLYDRYLQMMENALAQSRWVAGDTFSLADIGLAPYVNRLDMMGMSEMWTLARPRVAAWFDRIKNRPTFKSALLDWIPADLAADLATFGAQSWSEARSILQASGSR
jgi:glutathione S-transferase